MMNYELLDDAWPTDEELELVRNLFSSSKTGFLSTNSAILGGHPFSSVVSYTMIEDGGMLRPVLLLSDLAEHSKNLRADSRISLMVRDENDFGPAKARVSWIGTAVLRDDLSDKFAEARPDCKFFMTMKDFHTWALCLGRLRLVGGFGSAKWIEPQVYAGEIDSADSRE